VAPEAVDGGPIAFIEEGDRIVIDVKEHTIDLMVERKIAIDPTLGIHEQLTQRRDGQVPPGAVDYIDHMPIGFRRDSLKALADTSAPGDDKPIARHDRSNEVRRLRSRIARMS
jgi:hypothetical protein